MKVYLEAMPCQSTPSNHLLFFNADKLWTLLAGSFSSSFKINSFTS